MSLFSRRVALSCLLVSLTFPLVASNVAPQDFQSGDWSMTWDDTYVYVTRTNLTNALSISFDVDPLATPSGGTNANGTRQVGEMCCGATMPYTTILPFRADTRVVMSLTSATFYVRDGNGGWTAGSNSDILTSVSGSTASIRIRWAGIPGTSGRPSSFNWLAYDLAPSVGLMQVSMTNPIPSSNTAGANRLEYFFNVASTATGNPSNPFTATQSTWTVLSNADSGTGSLRDAITNANADTASTRRYVVFDETGDISVSTALPTLTQAMTIDGTTQSGWTSNPIVVVSCATPLSFAGLELAGGSGSIVRGLVMQNFNDAILISGGSAHKVAGNWLGLNAAGAAAIANRNGVRITGGASNTIGGTTAADRNVISGNTTDGIRVSSATGLTITGNWIGVASDGTTSIPNGDDGIDGLSTMTVGTIAAPNVIANNGSRGISAYAGSLLIRGNAVYGNGTSVLINGGESAPTVHAAAVNGSALSIELSETASGGTNSLQFDLYHATGTNAYVTSSTCYAASSLNHVTWSPAGTFTTDALKLMVTSYSDAACATANQGTSQETTFTPQTYSTTTTTLSGITSPAWTGSATKTLTASVSGSNGTIQSGTVAFTDNGNAIDGCGAVSVVNGSAQCSMTFSTAGAHAFVATYGGTVVNGASTSSTLNLTASTHTFTGPGSYTNTSLWSSNTLPADNEDATINGACTLNAVTSQLNTLTLNNGASLTLVNSGGVAAEVIATSVAGSGSASIDLGTGNILNLFGSGTVYDSTHVTLVPGTGSFLIYGTGVTLPAINYYNLRLNPNATVTSLSGTAVVVGQFTLSGGASITAGGTFELHGAITVSQSATMNVGAVSIPAGAIASHDVGSITAGTLTVDGTLTGDATFSGTTLNGSGTIKVTSTSGNTPFKTTYSFTNYNVSALTVSYVGTSSQVVDAMTYGNLTLANSNQTVVLGDVTVTGTLTLTAGITYLSGGSLYVTNTSSSAITRTAGWITTLNGTLYRTLPVGSGSFLYPIARNSDYQPVTLSFSGVTGSGTVGVNLGIGDAISSSGIDPTRDANSYWTISNTTSGGTFTALLDYTNKPDAGVTASAFVMRKLISGVYTNVATSGASSTSITGSGITLGATSVLYVGNQALDHFAVSAASSQTAGNSFTTTVTAQDVLNVQIADYGGTVTMSSNSANVQFDSNGDNTWGDNTKAASSGAFTIQTRDVAAETMTLAATASSKTGTSSSITVSGSTFGPPLVMSATASSSSQVVISWSAVSGATSYLVKRATTLTGTYVSAGSTSSLTLTDSGLSANTTYLYTVQAVGGSGTSSATAPDAATTVIYTDSSLSGATIRAVHITELRTAINAMRTAASIGTYSFTDSSLSALYVKAIHITQLRSALDAARSALGLSALTYTNSSASGQIIKAVDVTELRAGTQ